MLILLTRFYEKVAILKDICISMHGNAVAITAGNNFDLLDLNLSYSHLNIYY